ncbi:prepilin peptidase [Patescibacteria group bacterium]|nr:prepilin peptidase [Patescibacteria group bacterium]MCG2695838.1 prepilin peptidase [Candidatus Portnoybacteria bacterium]
MVLFYILIFVFGAIIGSFLNVIICRLNTGESILKNRSHCPFCNKKLVWYELIPIISFIIQLGKCQNCHKKISWQYPLVEFFTGIIFFSILITQYSLLNTLFLLLISCFLIIIFVYDFKHYLVADIIIYPAIIVAFLYQLQFPISNFQFPIFNYLLAGLIAGGFFLAIVLISKGKWMGVGDVKIGVLMGLIFGMPWVFIALSLAFFIGAIVSVALLALKKKTLQSEIPFGPFLVLATFVVIFWGDILLNWYLNLF